MSTPPPYLLEGLRDLADTAPRPEPDPGLWDVARRYHRRRRAGSLGIAVAMVLAVVGILGVGWQRAGDEPQPAAPGTAPALPTRLVTPSPWLPGTDDAGPLGPLALVLRAERGGWTGTEPSYAGISALTGEYRFLDLPDLADIDHEVALAPDGRHLAYWYAGRTTGAPHDVSGRPVAGVAVYETSTGEVRRLPVTTAHGLDPLDLLWADPERVVFGANRWLGAGGDGPLGPMTSDNVGLRVWEPASGRSPEDLLDAKTYFWVEASNGAGTLLVGLDSGHGVLDLDSPEKLNEIGEGPDANSSTAPRSTPRGPGSPGPGAPAVPTWCGSGGSPRVGVVDRTVVPDSPRTFRVLAWLDDDQWRWCIGWGRRRSGLRSAGSTVRTGATSEIMTLPSGPAGGVRLATGLLATPSVDRPLPPRPIDPRLLTGLSVGVVLAGLAAILRWRRRVRP